MVASVVFLLFALFFVSDAYAYRTVTPGRLLTKFSKWDAHTRLPRKELISSLTAKRRTTLSRRTAGGSQEEVKVNDDSEAPAKANGSEEIAAISTSQAIIPMTEDIVAPALSPVNKGRQLNQRIQDDISDFERVGALREKKVVEEENGITKTLKNIFAAVFIADFFVVIVFLIWFLAAAAMQKTDPFLLEKFQDIFQPVVVPSLTVLMVGSMASGAMEDQANKAKSKP